MPDPIVTEGNPVLRQVAEPVPKDLFKTDDLRAIVARMSASLRESVHGVAIAAPQIGIPYRIFVVSGFVITGNGRNLEDPDMVFINPTIIRTSRKKMLVSGEGCLSVPNVYGTIERAEKTTVRAYDVEGKKYERGGSGLLAEIFQHEVDHLDGILFIDNAIDLKTLPPEAPPSSGPAPKEQNYDIS